MTFLMSTVIIHHFMRLPVCLASYFIKTKVNFTPASETLADFGNPV